jgi:foldase protein PrsA
MLKMRELDWDYIDEHFDELKDEVTTSPRTISIITMEVENADILTEEKEEKKNNIDQALENGDDFASVATAFSEDADTAANGGFYGYVDSSNTDLDSSILTAAAALEKGQTSDWITVTDSSSGTINMYKIYINETDMRTIFDSDDSDVVVGLLSAFLNADSTIEYKAVAAAAKNLDITFEDESVKEKLDEYLSQYIGTDSADADSETEESKETESEKESTDSADADTTGGEEDETK